MPQTESKVFPDFANQTIAWKKAGTELERLREIERLAQLLHNEIILGYPHPPGRLKELGDLLDPPTDPDQLNMI